MQDPEIDDLGSEAELNAPARKRRRWRKLGGIRWLPSGKGQVRVRGVTPDGVPFALEQTVAPHLAEATLARFREMGEQYRAGLLAPEQTVTLSEWQRRYIAKRSVSTEAKRWTSEQQSTWKLLKPLHRLPLQALTSDAINGWAARVRWRGEGKAPRGSGKASQSYIRHAFELLNRLVTAALDQRIIARCPWGSKIPSEIPSYGKARKKRRPLEAHEVAAILAAAKRTDADALFLRLRTLYQTGVRPFELARCKIEWLLPVEAVPHVPQVPGAGVIKFPEAKRGQKHIAAIDPDLFAALRAYVLALPPAARASGLLFPVFWKQRWRRRSKFVQAVTFARLREDAKIGKDVVCYQSRHTRLSDVANDARMGTRAAQAMAGHQTDSSIIHAYLGHAERAISPAAFEVSPTLRAAGVEQLGDDDDPTPNGGGGKRTPRGRASVHASRVAQKTLARRNAKAHVESGEALARAPGHADLRARSLPPVPSEKVPTLHALPATLPESLDEHAGTGNVDRLSVPCDPSTPAVPTESELFLVAERVQREGAGVVADVLVGSLGPMDAAAFARELTEESAALPALERAALDALAQAVSRRARADVVPAMPTEQFSAVVAVGCEREASRCTRKISRKRDRP